MCFFTITFILQNFPLVTLYANLGDDAIVHGINQVRPGQSYFRPGHCLFAVVISKTHTHKTQANCFMTVPLKPMATFLESK
jgi:hypothetical protein